MRMIKVMLAWCVVCVLCRSQLGTVYFQDNSYKFVEGVYDVQGAAFGVFNDTLRVNGWGSLKIKSNGNYSDVVQMFAGGYLEGALTWHRIKEHHDNIYKIFFSNGDDQKVRKFFNEQDEWIRDMIKNNPQSEYWQAMNFVITQRDGVIEGYNKNQRNKKLDRFAFDILNANGDLDDVIHVVDPSTRINWMNMTIDSLNNQLLKTGRCSAIVKLNGDFTELFGSHSTWFLYSAMNRIYKNYFFDVSAPQINAKKLSFSSYPGAIVSIDDFYILSSGITMLETTNGIFNNELYDKVTPKSALAWQRVSIANRMARTGGEWANTFAQYNSGTYNNQYMLINYNLFKPGQQLQPGLLWVVEQIPGYVESADVTHELERGYWPSYNVPYFEDIYNRSGYPEIVQKYGTDYSYQLCPRAKIFRRDQGNIKDLASLKNFMRYNDYLHDPYSDKNAGKSICARGDLIEKAHLGGCIDTKVTSYELQSKMTCQAINGPTTSHHLPPFSWDKYKNTTHEGLPPLFNFNFITIDPNW